MGLIGNEVGGYVAVNNINVSVAGTDDIIDSVLNKHMRIGKRNVVKAVHIPKGLVVFKAVAVPGRGNVNIILPFNEELLFVHRCIGLRKNLQTKAYLPGSVNLNQDR